MIRMETTNGGPPAFLDPAQARSFLPTATGTRVVLDGGHKVDVLGTPEEVIQRLWPHRAATTQSDVGETEPDPLARWAVDFTHRMLMHLKSTGYVREDWVKDSPRRLLARVEDEFISMTRAVEEKAPADVIWKNAASVANMAGMVADAYENAGK